MEHLTQAWKTIYGGWNILNLQKFMHLKFSSFHTPPCPSKKTCLNRVILSLQSGSSVSTTTLQLLLSDVTPRRTMELQMKTIKQTMKLYISYVYRLYYIYILYIYIYIYIYISAIQYTTYIDISSNLTHQIPFQSWNLKYKYVGSTKAAICVLFWCLTPFPLSHLHAVMLSECIPSVFEPDKAASNDLLEKTVDDYWRSQTSTSDL